MRLRLLSLFSLLAVPAAPAVFGGWAVVTVENPPQGLVAGVPYTLNYTVRQHGVTLLPGLSGTVEAVAGNRKVTASSRAGAVGRYAATFTIPEAGDWSITVRSGFGNSMTKLLPVRVVKAGAVVADLPDAERGAQLFAAKGCVMCHAELKLDLPDPRTQAYDQKFVRQLLADPASVPKRRNVGMDMPNLELTPAEISALAAYLSASHATGTR